MSAAAALSSTLMLADELDGHHHDWGGGWWALMAVGMLLVWGLLIAGGIRLVRGLSDRPDGGPRSSEAFETLDRRLAEGAVSIEEYQQRQRALKEAREERAESG